MPKFDFCFSTTAKIDLQLEFHLGEKEMVENIRVFSLLIVITVEGFCGMPVMVTPPQHPNFEKGISRFVCCYVSILTPP
jgi:hypothetical protein